MTCARPATALVIEEDPAQRRRLAEMLLRHGVATVLEAAGGTEGLSRLEAPVDVVLCDLDLAGVDGIELLRHMARRTPQPAVVLLTEVEDRVLRSVRDLALARGVRIVATLTRAPSESAVAAALDALGHRPRIADLASATAPVTRSDLVRAIQTEELEVFYQPQVRVSDRAVVGAEALVRWRHPEFGIITPEVFIPLAERTGLVDPLTDRVFAVALGHCGPEGNGAWGGRLSVNVSVYSLTRLDLPDRLADLAARHGIDPGQLVLEVTESGLMRDVIAPLDVLSRLRLRGIGLAIDDFGTGWASLRQLIRFPFTELKVDGSFVRQSAREASARAVVEACVGLGEKLGMRVVAEGVETEADWAAAAGAGCHEVQGFFVTKPLPGDQLSDWVAAWPHGSAA